MSDYSVAKCLCYLGNGMVAERFKNEKFWWSYNLVDTPMNVIYFVRSSL